MKLQRLSTAATFLFLQFALFSCHKEQDVEQVQTVVPLHVGNEWLYDVFDYDTEGNVLSTRSFRRVVLKDTIINKSTWYKLSDGGIVQNSREGYVFYDKASKEAYIIYPSISQAGIGYGYEYPGYHLWVLTSRTNELAPVPGSAGGFSSYVFSFERQMTQPTTSTVSTTWVKDYVSPEVGMVRSDRYYADSDKLMSRSELVSYRVE